MKRILSILGFVWLSTSAFAGGLGDPNPPASHYTELAGTVVTDSNGAFVLKSNGHEYYLDVDASAPGVSRLKSGMAIIVKGQLTITDDSGTGKTRMLRPTEMIIRGRAYEYADPVTP